MLYIYDPVTFEFLHEHPVLDEKSGLRVCNSTTLPPDHANQRFIDGKWVDMPAEMAAAKSEAAITAAWAALRAKRDRLLAGSDKTQMPDRKLANLAEWVTYRQALRDLPANTKDPLNPMWPTEPKE